MGWGRSTTTASIIAVKSLVSWMFAPSIATPSGAAPLLDDELFLIPCLNSVGGTGPLSSPSCMTCPSPLRRPATPRGPCQLIALGDQGPDLLQNTGEEALEPAVHGGVRPEGARQLVPLHPRAHPVDDRVQHQAQVGPRPAGRRNRIAARPGSARSAPRARRAAPRSWVGGVPGSVGTGKALSFCEGCALPFQLWAT